ncbi:unnamed protein product, partial [Symbiodinium sp. KB8]
MAVGATARSPLAWLAVANAIAVPRAHGPRDAGDTGHATDVASGGQGGQAAVAARPCVSGPTPVFLGSEPEVQAALTKGCVRGPACAVHVLPQVSGSRARWAQLSDCRGGARAAGSRLRARGLSVDVLVTPVPLGRIDAIKGGRRSEGTVVVSGADAGRLSSAWAARGVASEFGQLAQTAAAWSRAVASAAGLLLDIRATELVLSCPQRSPGSRSAGASPSSAGPSAAASQLHHQQQLQQPRRRKRSQGDPRQPQSADATAATQGLPGARGGYAASSPGGHMDSLVLASADADDDVDWDTYADGRVPHARGGPGGGFAAAGGAAEAGTGSASDARKHRSRHGLGLAPGPDGGPVAEAGSAQWATSRKHAAAASAGALADGSAQRGAGSEHRAAIRVRWMQPSSTASGSTGSPAEPFQMMTDASPGVLAVAEAAVNSLRRRAAADSWPGNDASALPATSRLGS